MNYKPALLWVLTVRTVTLVFCLATLNGCFGGVPFGPAANEAKWHQYVTPRPPENPIENTVVQVAKTKKDIKTADSEILFIVNDSSKAKPVQLVDVVSNTESEDQFPERTVTRYRIIDGMIAAMSDPTTEFYVNADLERAILRAISISKASDRVVIYNDGTRSMPIVAYSVDQCTADVKIYEDASTGGVGRIPKAEKRVVFCFVK
jgi:hypothetical protein